MSYIVKHKGSKTKVDVEKIDVALFDVSFDNGKVIRMDAHKIQPNCFLVVYNDMVYEFDVDWIDGKVEIFYKNSRLDVDIGDEKKELYLLKKQAYLSHGETCITAPMPGKIIYLLAKEGEKITKGQGLVIIEAMKMENELKSPSDGMVAKVHVEEGQAVAGKSPLITIIQNT